jgi:predicted transcriptional regulator
LKVAIALNKDVAKALGKSYRTLHSYRDDTRTATLDVAKRLSQYLRERAKAMLKAADALDEVISKQEERNG